MATLQMRHCMACGAKLEMKYHEQEKKEVPWCPVCKDWRFPVFSTAVSMIVMDEAKTKILLIKQYGRDAFILVAGYVNQGEDAEHAAVREVWEETGLCVTSLHFNRSRYFAPSNTLMLNFTVTVREDLPHPNEEVDAWSIFTREQARGAIKRPSLAADFLDAALDEMETERKPEAAPSQGRPQKEETYLIASDLHGSAKFTGELLAAFRREGADRLLLLGDLLYHGPRNDLPEGYAPKEVIRLLSPLADRILCVRGNCEAEVDQMVLPFPVLADYAVLDYGGQVFYATHGHHYHPDQLPPMAKEDILLYGHTHVPDWRRDGSGVLCCNPGSVSLPKQDSARGYILLQGKTLTWKTLAGKPYHRLVLGKEGEETSENL